MPFFFRAQNDFSRGSEKQSFCFDVLLNHFAAPAIATAITPPLPTLKNSNGFGWHLGATKGERACRTVHRLTIITRLLFGGCFRLK